MKKICLILAVTMALAVAGCSSEKTTIVYNQNKSEIEEEHMKMMEKFMHNGDTYTPELFVEMADYYEGILSGEGQQVYIFDLRSKEEYNKGHIEGSINITFLPEEAEKIIERIPDDYDIYIIGKTDEEAKAMAASLKALDEFQYIYTIEGGYEALINTDGIDKYITTEPEAFSDFTRTKAAKKFEALVESSQSDLG